MIQAPTPLLLSQSRPEPEIQAGDSGALVEALQRRLTDLGYYSGPITGFFGEMTETAVIRFQRDHELTTDGIVGTGTANALRRAGGAAPRRDNPLTLEVGDQGPAVETLQNQLTTLGYYDGPITGYFGPLTESALKDFQAAQGLVVDGVVGSATQSALDNALQGQAAPQSTSSVASASDGGDSPDPNDGILESGEAGSDIAVIQRQLQVLGYYNDSIDGDFGQNTETAVIAFQRSQSLTVDGKVGPATTAALDSVVRSLGTTSPSASSSSVATASSTGDAGRISDLPPAASTGGASSSSVGRVSAVPGNVGGTAVPAVSDRNVLEVQRRLQDQGFYSGALDGDLGPATRQAIQSAQRRYGLDGEDFDL
ncbi:MAG: peptidoglycan-binding protein [Merismopedia sp. SIO2A8]|nr:peptidoglycan-binding protein [Merismopedia sp. SIO2A8]